MCGMSNVHFLQSPRGLALLAIPFLSAGLLVMIFLAAKPMARLVDSASWIECEAEIDPASVSLRTSSGGKGGTSYQARASYTYTAPDGKTRVSDRVAFCSGSDNLGSWQSRTHRRLKEMSRKKTVCHVNPCNMDDAVLLREVHELSIICGSLFGFAFACAGAGMLLPAIRMWRWGEQRDGGGEVVRSASQLTPADAVVAAVPVCLNLWILSVFVTRVPDASAWVWLLLIPVAVPLLVVGYGFRMRRIFGDAAFRPAGTIRVGGRLAGDITLTAGNPDGRFEVSVECMKSQSSGSGKNRSTVTTCLWKASQNVSQGIPGDGISVRVALDIPDGLPETDAIGNTTITWVLKLRAKDRRRPNSIAFQLDVHKPLTTGAIHPMETGAAPGTDETRLFEENGIRMGSMPSGGLEIMFPGEESSNERGILLEKVKALGSLVGPAVFVAAGVFMARDFLFHTRGQAGGMPRPFMLAFFGVFAIPLVIGICSCLSALCRVRKKHSTRVLTIERTHGAALHSVFGDRRKKIAEIPDILNLAVRNVNGKGEKTGSLYIHPRSAKAILLTEHLRTPESASLIGERLTRRIYRSNGV